MTGDIWSSVEPVVLTEEDRPRAQPVVTPTPSRKQPGGRFVPSAAPHASLHSWNVTSQAARQASRAVQPFLLHQALEPPEQAAILGDDDVDMDTGMDMDAVVMNLLSRRGGQDEIEEMQDVEMVDVSELPNGEEGIQQLDGTTYVVIDTNVLISHLPIVIALHAFLVANPPTRPTRLLIPNTVIRELDKHKMAYSRPEFSEASLHSRPAGIGAIARSAVDWLLLLGRRAREKGIGGEVLVRCQRMDEVQDRGLIAKADDRILDCCRYFHAVHHNAADSSAPDANKVFLWTDDKNLALQAETHAVPSFGNKAFSIPDIIQRIDSQLHERMLQVHGAANGPMKPLASAHDGPRLDRVQSPANGSQPAGPSRREISIHAPPLGCSLAAPAFAHRRDKEPRSKSGWKGCNGPPQTGSNAVEIAGTSRWALASRGLSETEARNRSKCSTIAASGKPASARATQDVRPPAKHTSTWTPERKAPPPNAAVQAFLNHPSVETLAEALARTISLSLWSALLIISAGRDASTLRLQVLRPVLGDRDPGPGAWNLRSCVALLINTWQSMHILYAPSADMRQAEIKDSNGEAWLAELNAQERSHDTLRQAAPVFDALNDLAYVCQDLEADMRKLSLDDISTRNAVSHAISAGLLKGEDSRDCKLETSSKWWLSEDEQKSIQTIITALTTTT